MKKMKELWVKQSFSPECFLKQVLHQKPPTITLEEDFGHFLFTAIFDKCVFGLFQMIVFSPFGNVARSIKTDSESASPFKNSICRFFWDRQFFRFSFPAKNTIYSQQSLHGGEWKGVEGGGALLRHDCSQANGAEDQWSPEDNFYYKAYYWESLELVSICKLISNYHQN